MQIRIESKLPTAPQPWSVPSFLAFSLLLISIYRRALTMTAGASNELFFRCGAIIYMARASGTKRTFLLPPSLPVFPDSLTFPLTFFR